MNTLRISSDERTMVKEWLARLAQRTNIPLSERRLDIAQAKPLTPMRNEADPNDWRPSYDVASFEAHELLYNFRGPWRQWVAIEIQTGEPIVFGEMRQAR